MLIPLILAGGQGSRLYPISEPHNPKQFKKILSDYSMLQNTLMRLKHPMFSQPIILSNLKYLPKLLMEMQTIDAIEYKFMLETKQINTALAILLALLQLQHQDIVITLPSDQHIENTDTFIATIKKAIPNLKDTIIVLSTLMKYQSNDYGLIFTENQSTEHKKVISFLEKPNHHPNASYGYYWNTGIALFNVSTMLKEFYNYCPELVKFAKDCLSIKIGSRILIHKVPEHYNRFKYSIDEAIMSKAENLFTYILNCHWYDFGNLTGIFDYIKDQILSLIAPKIFYKKWGKYVVLFQSKECCIKHLFISPKSCLSLQYHELRDEFLQAYKGRSNVIIDKEMKNLEGTNIVTIKRFTCHKIFNPSSNTAEIIEIQYGLIDEDDIVRLDD